MILWLTRVTNENLHKIDRHEDNAEEISLAWDWPWENDQLIANKRDAKIDPGEKREELGSSKNNIWRQIVETE